MPGMWEKLTGFFNKLVGDEEDEYTDETGETTPKPKPELPEEKKPFKKPSPSGMQINTAKGMYSVNLITKIEYPKTAKEAVDQMKKNVIVVFNFEDSDQEASQKTVDFISGAAYSLTGTVQPVSEYVVMLIPKDIPITPEQKKQIEEKNMFGPTSY
ncbi:cell division protein SepF [bacterium]|nr:cell division protein SepF [bacterium]